MKTPDHYATGRIQPIEYIMDHGLDFCLGNVVKYVSRAGHKDGESRLSDLKKARDYIGYAIGQEEARQDGNDAGAAGTQDGGGAVEAQEGRGHAE